MSRRRLRVQVPSTPPLEIRKNLRVIGGFSLVVIVRGVAQPGRALALGARCREFESRRPDHLRFGSISAQIFQALHQKRGQGCSSWLSTKRGGLSVVDKKGGHKFDARCLFLISICLQFDFSSKSSKNPIAPPRTADTFPCPSHLTHRYAAFRSTVTFFRPAGFGWGGARLNKGLSR